MGSMGVSMFINNVGAVGSRGLAELHCDGVASRGGVKVIRASSRASRRCSPRRGNFKFSRGGCGLVAGQKAGQAVPVLDCDAGCIHTE